MKMLHPEKNGCYVAHIPPHNGHLSTIAIFLSRQNPELLTVETLQKLSKTSWNTSNITY